MFYKKAHILLIGFFGFITSGVFAQDQKIADSLAVIYQQNLLEDTAKLELLTELSFNETRDLNKGLKYAEELISLSEQTGNNDYLRRGYFLKGTKKRLLGQLTEALEAFFKSAEIAKRTNHLTSEGETYDAIADTYSVANNHSTAIYYYNKAVGTLRRSNDSISLASALINTGDEFRKISRYDSALLYFRESQVIFDKKNHLTGKAFSLGDIGMIYAAIGKNDLAEKNINEAIHILEGTQNYYPICDYLISMADMYMNKGDSKEALNYTLRSLHLAEQYGLNEQVATASLKLSDIYEKQGNLNEALKYYKKHIQYRDSINNINTVQKMADLRTNYEVSQKQSEVNMLNQQKQNEKNLTLLLGVILGLTIIILGILIKNNQNKQKAYKILNLQKQETDRQKAKAENAFTELQATQKQLVQTAKMASLGELTAGIAHEIQNPLNFVNNFSEVSVELLDELRTDISKKLTNADKTAADEIIYDLVDNLKKINDHGKRADLIVKAMLLHSKASSGKKELTDINALADEYLRLSYHGLKAKDKDFYASVTTDFDESIGKLEIVPQDIGRVLLNLYNNAFYAVKEKKKQINGTFEPAVSVTTKSIGNKVELFVKDNGTGISQTSFDKIFQPFFTTKPTGQGIGLGLSISYDIIKAHGGELKVETKEGEFTEFIIQLPGGNNNATLI